MNILYVIRNNTAQVLEYAEIKVREFFHTEVPKAVFDALSQEVKDLMLQHKNDRIISVHMVSDGQPVDQMNEGTVLKMAEVDADAVKTDDSTVETEEPKT